jgi:predicted RNase H-like HicB family nuclease
MGIASAHRLQPPAVSTSGEEWARDHRRSPKRRCGPPYLKEHFATGRAKIMDMKYTAIYTKTKTGYSAHIPDLPGCIAAARTLAQTKQYMGEAVALHLQGMREDGTRIPRPSTVAAEVEAA